LAGPLKRLWWIENQGAKNIYLPPLACPPVPRHERSCFFRQRDYYSTRCSRFMNR